MRALPGVTAEAFDEELEKAGDSGTLGMSGLEGVEWLEAGSGASPPRLSWLSCTPRAIEHEQVNRARATWLSLLLALALAGSAIV